MKSKIKKGDKVLVISGKDKGKTGVVEQVLASLNKARVAGVNVAKKHSKRSGRAAKAGLIDINQSISIAKLKIVCPHCGKTARIKFRLDPKGRKERYCSKCSAAM